MGAVLRFMRDRVNKAVARDRRAEKYVDALSRAIWRWRERWLIVLVGIMAILDYVTTYAALELSVNDGIQEGGMLAGWALNVGGMGWLFLIDMGVVIALSLVAIAMRFLYLKLGFKGFGRACFVFLLMPYAAVAFVAVVNNLAVTFV